MTVMCMMAFDSTVCLHFLYHMLTFIRLLSGHVIRQLTVSNTSLHLQRNIEEERLRIRQRSQQADEQQHMRTTVLLDNSGRKANGQRPRSDLAARRGLQADKQRGGSPAPRAHSPALQPSDDPHRSQSPAVAAAQPGPAPKKHLAKSKLGELPIVCSRLLFILLTCGTYRA